MLLDLDDYPVHQAPASLAHVMGGHPNAYDRFWFNAYREDLFVGISLGLYPNRGVIDAAVGVVHGGVQRSVFTSGVLRARETRVGPISVEIVEPLRVNTVRVDAPDQGSSPSSRSRPGPPRSRSRARRGTTTSEW
jgi:hypothetical protein